MSIRGVRTDIRKKIPSPAILKQVAGEGFLYYPLRLSLYFTVASHRWTLGSLTMASASWA